MVDKIRNILAGKSCDPLCFYTFADAFAVDNVARYFIDTPDSKLSEEKKWQLHVKNLEYVVAAHCYSGMVTTIGPNHDAVALWYAIHPN